MDKQQDNHTAKAQETATQASTWPQEEVCQPADLYKRLAESLNTSLSIKDRMLITGEVFRQATDQYVAHCALTFTGLFSKLDYIIKQRGIARDDAALLHFTRRTLRSMGSGHEPSSSQLQKDLPQHLQAAALLVSYTTGTGIPPSLQAHFPRKKPDDKWKGYDLNLIRCIVRQADKGIITAEEEQHADTLQVCYDKRNTYLTRNGAADWSYLEHILTPGTQINLVRVRMEKGMCMPELIIYEPDYLINVTAIASCFETYAESPYVNMINRLKQQPNTEHIHLGNLTGQFLDDTVHGRQIDFAESMTRFFQHHALEMLACPGLQTRQQAQTFYANAQAQLSNIAQLIGHDLPASVRGYDTKHVVLEPTFFSEVLGIQGRLDFLHTHHGRAVIIEQKSGKGDFVPQSSPQYNPDVPKPQEKHLVQLIMYRALLVYEMQMRSEDLEHIMLLYSRYTHGLVSVGQMPELMLRAIRMRNLLAWCEIDCAEQGFGWLENLTPEALNKKHTSGKLWEMYTRPELESLLSPIRQSSITERAYFLRFMQFIAKEKLLAKVGSKTKEDSGFASKWLSSLEEKRAAGNIYESLTLEDFKQEEEAISKLTAHFAERLATDTSNFRRGDIVLLYPYHDGEEPDACRQMVYRATIEDITPEGIRLALRNKQTDEKVFCKGKDTRWAIEHDLFDSSSDSLCSGLHRFLSAPASRKSLLLCQREPTTDDKQLPKGEYGDFNTLVTRAKQAQELFIIIGPPGTGKTSYGMLNLVREQLLEQDTNILLLSYTNRAVDEMCGKLDEQGIDYLRIGSELSCSPACQSHLLSSKLANCTKGSQARELVMGTRIFCGTTASLNATPWLFHLKHFHLAIIDEASQILEPHIVGLLSMQSQGLPSIGKFVLIGDHKQLPAVVQQSESEARVDEPCLHDIGLTDCRVSLFQRLLSHFRTPDGYDPRFVYMLTRQGRMHSQIAAFPSMAFYAGMLQPVPLKHQEGTLEGTSSTNGIARMLTTHRLAFVDSEPPSLAPSSKTNEVEAKMIAAIVQQIYLLHAQDFDTEQTVGIIVPYRNQISAIRNAIDTYGIPCLHDISIDTVERFQGSQRDYIIYGFTIQHLWQLNFLASNTFIEDNALIDRKLNVAMTRARLQMTLVGNSMLLSHNHVFSQMMGFIQGQGAFIHTSAAHFCQGDFAVPPAK